MQICQIVQLFVGCFFRNNQPVFVTVSIIASNKRPYIGLHAMTLQLYRIPVRYHSDFLCDVLGSLEGSFQN
jgi:hypothetical protein